MQISKHGTPRRFASAHYAWLPLVLVCLLPIWTIGLFDRGLWTPDEPREADIAWRMSTQSDRVLPQLAGVRFLEKPPLSYWMSALSLRLFGESAAAARAANLLYALVVAAAIGALAFSMAGARAACVAAIVASSAFTSYQVSIWLTPDACLVAGCALALLGAYRGYVAESSREKLLWYTLMHLGALAGFMAKSGPGWLVPALALTTLVIWERRWSELLRWQLWAGFGLQLILLGGWIIAVLREPDGTAALRILFWNNLVGRFVDLHAAGALDYASAHQNWLGKYWVELPYYLFPWALLVFAAARVAWRELRARSAQATAWRFAIAACLPFFILISLATTARSIYAAPAILGFSLLAGIWSAAQRFDVYDQWAVRGTRYSIALFAVVMTVALGILAVAEFKMFAVSSIVVAIAAIVCTTPYALRASARAQQAARMGRSFLWMYAAFAGSLCLSSYALFPAIDRWQDLGGIARAIQHDTYGSELALLQPDETTLAMLDYHLGMKAATLEGMPREIPQRVADWLKAHPHNGRVLVDLPGHAPGEISRLFERFSAPRVPSDGEAAELVKMHIARIVNRYELPQGRRYALLGPPDFSFAD